MRKHCIDVYNFSELSDAAKEEARSWWRESSCGDMNDEFVIEDFVERAAECGWEVSTYDVRLMSGRTCPKPLVWYSGFSCQGDGACFEGRWRADRVDAAAIRPYLDNDTKLLRIVDGFTAFAAKYPEGTAKVQQQGRDSNEHNTIFETDTGVENAEDCFPHEDEKDFIDLSRDLMRWLYARLEEEYDYRNSDAVVDDDLQANEYEFTVDGNRSMAI